MTKKHCQKFQPAAVIRAHVTEDRQTDDRRQTTDERDDRRTGDSIL